MSVALATRPDYGVDAPHVMRNLFLCGALAALLIVIAPDTLHLGFVTVVRLHRTFGVAAFFLLGEAGLFLLYVKFGKFRHRDFMLAMHTWQGDEQVLDVGCGRGLLLAGAAKRLTSGHATAIDIWSNVDMGGNSEAATLQNLTLEQVVDRCTLISAGAQQMPLQDESFDVVLSNLCLHNIYDRPTRVQALREIARVLKPGGVAIISDYKKTSEYAGELRALGFDVQKRWGSFLTTFPPLCVVIARKA